MPNMGQTACGCTRVGGPHTHTHTHTFTHPPMYTHPHRERAAVISWPTWYHDDAAVKASHDLLFASLRVNDGANFSRGVWYF